MGGGANEDIGNEEVDEDVTNEFKWDDFASS
jgi:hypothetical protein